MGHCTALAVLFVYPLYVMIPSRSSRRARPPRPADAVSALAVDANYSGLASGEGLNVFDNVLNSVVVSVGATLATVVLSTLGGYAFARLRFPAATSSSSRRWRRS